MSFSDWISLVQVLPDTRITLWNPPPAFSLALLLMKGMKFAPALFPAAVLSDAVSGGFSIGVFPTLVEDMIIAAGYRGRFRSRCGRLPAPGPAFRACAI